MPRASKGLLATALLALGLQLFVLAWGRSAADVRMIWMSVLLPLLVLGVAAHMIHERPLLATVVAVSTLASAGLRVVIVQYQQQKSAAAIAEAEQKFRALFHDNPQPTCLYDPTTGAIPRSESGCN